MGRALTFTLATFAAAFLAGLAPLSGCSLVNTTSLTLFCPAGAPTSNLASSPPPLVKPDRHR